MAGIPPAVDPIPAQAPSATIADVDQSADGAAAPADASAAVLDAIIVEHTAVADDPAADAGIPIGPGALLSDPASPVEITAPVAQAPIIQAPLIGTPLIGAPRRPVGNTYQVRRAAYAAVFDQWGIAFHEAAEGQIPCDFAPSVGLQCLSERGDWTEIEQLDLPVVLELWDEQEAPYYAALTKLKDAQITLHLDGEDIHTSQRALRDLWFGSYVVLWRTPPGYSGSLRIGDSHETVAWLRRQLAELNPATDLEKNSRTFDAALQAAILDFQQQEALLADGIVGPATWIRIAHRLRLPAPGLAD